MQADHTAPVLEIRELLIDASIDRVWDTLSDFFHWNDWMPGVKSASLHGPLAVGTVFTWKHGSTNIKSELLEVERPTELAWKGKALGLHAIHVWTFAEKEDGKVLAHVEESMNGLLTRITPGLVRKITAKAVNEGLYALKEKCEKNL